MINHNPVYQEEGLHYSHKFSPDQETKVAVAQCPPAKDVRRGV